MELGLVFIWAACVRRRQGKGVPGENIVEKAWFLAPPENPAQPTCPPVPGDGRRVKSFCRLFERAKMLLFEEVTL